MLVLCSCRLALALVYILIMSSELAGTAQGFYALLITRVLFGCTLGGITVSREPHDRPAHAALVHKICATRARGAGCCTQPRTSLAHDRCAL